MELRPHSNATAAQLEELCQYVQDTSPVRDILAARLQSAGTAS
jgi:hypothetical protein